MFGFKSNKDSTEPIGDISLESLRVYTIYMYKMNFITLDECNKILQRLRGNRKVFGISTDIANVLNLDNVIIMKND